MQDTQVPPFTSGAVEGSSEVGEEEKPLSANGGRECEHKSELYGGGGGESQW